jgi:multidrug efflux pump subunit AcrA (membrane-fusion protein)
VVLVSAAALRRDTQGNNFVWIVNDGRARRAMVETGGDVGTRVRIASGLNGGELVVVGEPPTRDGQRVQVAP